MAKTFTAAFAQTPRTFYASPVAAFTLTGAASTADDNPSNTLLLVTAGAEGALLTNISIIPRATVVACLAGIFLSKDGGTTKKLVETVSISAQTLAATVLVTQYTALIASETAPLRLEAGDRIYVGLSVANANGVNFIGKSVDY